MNKRLVDIRMTWRETGTAIVHGVNGRGGLPLSPPASGFLFSTVMTDCGIDLLTEAFFAVRIDTVTCVPCLLAHGDITVAEPTRSRPVGAPDPPAS